MPRSSLRAWSIRLGRPASAPAAGLLGGVSSLAMGLTPIVVSGLAVGLVSGLVPGSALAASPVHTYELSAEVQGVVLDDGSIRLERTGSGRPLLEVLLPLSASRRVAAGSNFTANFTEGAPAGLRGFAREADDDGDGHRDEDPADGRDNDGDGLVDEDFAAISDAMAVVDRSGSGRRLHLETYNWAYCHLRSTLAVCGRLQGGSGREREDDVIVELADGQWYEGELTCPVEDGTHPVRREDPANLRQSDRLGADEHGTASGEPETAGRVRLFAAEVSGGGGGSFWLGVTVLAEPPRTGPDQAVQRHPLDRPGRVRVVEGRLVMPLLADETAGDPGYGYTKARRLAVSVAPTYLQLRANLMAAHCVFHGTAVAGGTGGVPWLVAPASLAYRTAPEPSVTWERSGPEAWRLVFRVEPGQNALFDPDRFRLDDRPLGSPLSVRWRGLAAAGNRPPGSLTHDWTALSAPDIEQRTEKELDPYFALPELRHFTAEGELIFEFGGPIPDPAGTDALVTGHTLDGRPFAGKLAVESLAPAAAPQEPAASSQQTGPAEQDLGKQPPTLSPHLLENYPNPFHQDTRIHFRVPATIEEGFVWEDAEVPRLDPQTQIPYRADPPTVSVKIYDISGRELATLFTGSLGAGSYQAVWDGTDASGKTVASGTYFCKFQVEEWSVTKGLIFVR